MNTLLVERARTDGWRAYQRRDDPSFDTYATYNAALVEGGSALGKQWHNGWMSALLAHRRAIQLALSYMEVAE